MRRFYDDSDRRIMSSTRTLVTLLRPWIRRFTIIISAWWLRTSSKFTWEEVKTSTGKLGKRSTPKRVQIRPKHSAPSLSRDRRIKMHQPINQSIIYLKESLAKTSKNGIHSFHAWYFRPRCKLLGAIALQFLHIYSQSFFDQEIAKWP